ncbi:MAG: sulfite exporter TauE/SafE family protein [Planctomycetota bacterium]|jgi:uncharacterized membrane protein YfcA
MPELEPIGWFVIGLCAFLVGAAKTGIPGIGILPALLMAQVLPALQSTGMLLGILILGDLFGAGYHRRNAKWSHMIRLLPAAFAGIVAGYFAMKRITDDQLKPIIGVIVLVMLVLNYWRTRSQGADLHVPRQWWFAAGLGFMAGLTSMMANAAGPIMIIYFVAMRLPKVEFVGTSAWFFFIVNWLKVAFSANLDLMTAESVKLNLMMVPAIAMGAVVGIVFLKRIPQKVFNTVVQVLAVAGAVKLLL